MKDDDILIQILSELKNGNADRRLWSMDDIATYLNTSKSTVQTRIICKLDFPAAIRIPTEQGRTNRRGRPRIVKSI